MRFLVTAGNTREAIDDVRDWGNIFTGNTGLAIAKALAAAGEVDLLTSNQMHLAELTAPHSPRHLIHAAPFRSHQDLKFAIAGLLAKTAYDAVFMTAAVADYRPVRVYAVLDRQVQADGTEHWIVKDAQAPKVKSYHKSIAIRGEPTEKIIDHFRKDWGYKGLLVKFKLEVGITVEELLKIGENSRVASGADYLVANTLAMVNGPAAGAYLLRAGGYEWVPRERLAERMVSLVKS